MQRWRNIYEGSIYYLCLHEETTSRNYLKRLLEETSTYHNNLNESSTTKINKQTPSGCSLFTHC